MMRWLSQYHYRYPRSLVYMLQASEYQLGEYLGWLGRVKDFRRVEYRKQLVKTPKSQLLQIAIWLSNVLILSAVVVVCTSSLSIWAKIGAILLLLGWPWVSAYLIVVPLLVGQILIQKPREFLLIKRTKAKLAVHKGLKIAVAGSYGKTTMREILKTVLSQAKKVGSPPHSYNTPLGIAKFVSSLEGDEEVLIFEFGEFKPNDIRKFCKITRPDIGVLTGVNEAHLGQFKNLDNIKANFGHLTNYFTDKTLYVNAEDKNALAVAGKKAKAYSRHGLGEWKVVSAQTGLNGTAFIAKTPKSKILARSKLLGLHQIGPLILSIAVADTLGLSAVEIEKGLAKTKPFDHRLEPKVLSDGVVLLDDTYNGNPDGVKAGLAFLKSLRAERKIYITPGLVETGNKTVQLHHTMAKAIAAVANVVILIDTSAATHIKEGLELAKFKGERLEYDDALECAEALPHITKQGDVVLWQNDWPDNYY